MTDNISLASLEIMLQNLITINFNMHWKLHFAVKCSTSKEAANSQQQFTAYWM